MDPAPQNEPITTWGNYRIIRGLHFLDPLGGLGSRVFLMAFGGCREFPKLGYRFRGPNDKDYSTWGSILDVTTKR